VIVMRAYWILPNRDQGDEILASDGDAIVPLRRILEPKLRPEGLSHGVPTELLEKCGKEQYSEILFAQRFPGWNGDKELFSLSTTAGVDTSGRVVHIGQLFVLGRGERPAFDLPCTGLPEEDAACARALIRRMTSATGDPWVTSVRELLELPPTFGPATNVALDRSVVEFHSLYVLGPGGLKKKVTSRKMKWFTGVLLLLIVIASGVVTWRLS
jgi:hypothetical protein